MMGLEAAGLTGAIPDRGTTVMDTDIHIIAEAGANHNGDFDTALGLADTALAAGAQSVKFQLIYPEGLYLPQLFRNGRYQDNDIFERRKACRLSDDDWRRLDEHCRNIGLLFSASVFDQRGIDLLKELEVPYIKIASCDLNHERLLKAAADTGLRVILSTGMSSLDEIEQAVLQVLSTGNQDLVLMHCVSIYPCPTARMNLGFLKVLKQAFGFPVGLSDHTENSLAAAVAVAWGVEWLEKHFTLDRTAPGFDHAHSMDPQELTGWVQDVRAVQSACRPPVQKISPQEMETRARARRGIFAARNLAEGEVLKEEDLLVVRPESPFSPNDLNRLIGRRVRRAIRTFEPLDPDHLVLQKEN